MAIKINNLTNFALDEKSFSQVAKKILLGENKGTQTVSLALVGKEEIKKLNKKFRNKDKATDVLSFELSDKDYLGEVVICPEVVKEKGEEMLEVFAHGVLHLCGYDHEKSAEEEEAMEQKQNLYLSK